MNDRILALLTEFDEMGFSPTTVCEDPEAFAVRWRDQVLKEVNELKAENALLKEKLSFAEKTSSEATDRFFEHGF